MGSAAGCKGASVSSRTGKAEQMKSDPDAPAIAEDRGYAFLVNLCILQCAMLFPTDEGARRVYLEATIAKSLLHSVRQVESEDDLIKASAISWALGKVEAYPDILDRALRGPWVAPKDEEKNGLFLDGFIAAYVLLVPCFILARDGKRVGKEETYKALGRYLIEGNYTGRDRPRLIAGWTSHQAVAHLWAAYMLRNHEWPRNHNELTDFWKLSEVIRQWAEGYRPLRSRTTLLEGSMTQKPLGLAPENYHWSPENGLPISDEWARIGDCVRSAL
jgi:hypothetical protein